MPKDNGKRKRGRPKVDDAERLSFTIAIRIPGDVMHQIEELANAETTISQVARNLLIAALEPKGLLDRFRRRVV